MPESLNRWFLEQRCPLWLYLFISPVRAVTDCRNACWGMASCWRFLVTCRNGSSCSRTLPRRCDGQCYPPDATKHHHDIANSFSPKQRPFRGPRLAVLDRESISHGWSGQLRFFSTSAHPDRTGGERAPFARLFKSGPQCANRHVLTAPTPTYQLPKEV